MTEEKNDRVAIEVEWYRFCDSGASAQKELEVCVRLKERGVDKEVRASGDNPVDAIFNAIDKIFSLDNNFQGSVKRDLKVGAIKNVGESEGPKATAMISVSLNGFKADGEGIDVDILRASAKAYVSAISQVIAQASV